VNEKRSIALGFRAFDLHELLVHFIARELGFYAESGLEVTLRDLTFLPEDTPGIDFTVACGAALMGWAKGIRRKIVFVATDYPMFWLHSRPEITRVAELKGARIASYPAASPPGQFFRAILRQQGLDPDHDFINEGALEAVRDDAARLGLLKSGDVSAAVLSSAIPLPQMRAEGFRNLIFFGDHIRVPTTGLAVSEQFLTRHPEVVERMTEALTGALSALHTAPEKVIPIVAQFFGGSAAVGEETYQLLEKYFTQEGKAAPDAARCALEMLNAQLPAGHRLGKADIYDESMLPG
jgi:ABC-type nitrate/sulfonate/bicarbonate transport system substrate-binding protein